MQTTQTIGIWLFFCLTLSFVLYERPYGGPSRMDERGLQAKLVQLGADD